MIDLNDTFLETYQVNTLRKMGFNLDDFQHVFNDVVTFSNSEMLETLPNEINVLGFMCKLSITHPDACWEIKYSSNNDVVCVKYRDSLLRDTLYKTIEFLFTNKYI